MATVDRLKKLQNDLKKLTKKCTDKSDISVVQSTRNAVADFYNDSLVTAIKEAAWEKSQAESLSKSKQLQSLGNLRLGKKKKEKACVGLTDTHMKALAYLDALDEIEEDNRADAYFRGVQALLRGTEKKLDALASDIMIKSKLQL